MRNKVTIDAWIARDKYVLCSKTDLYLQKEEPERDMVSGTWLDIGEYYPLPQDAFPEITWESEPKKVKVTIELEE